MTKSDENGYALLVGISNYYHLHPLQKPRVDAEGLRTALVQHNGYHPQKVTLLTDDRATKAEINNQLDRIARETQDNDTVVIFFSGHGAQRIGGFDIGEYLCTVESDWNALPSTAISTEELSAALQAIRARKIAMFIDACHSGGIGEPKKVNSQVKNGLSEKAYEHFVKHHGRVIIASCSPNESSWELDGMHYGLFTHYLLQGLEQGGKCDLLSVFDLFQYVYHNVVKHAESAGVDQTPLIKANAGDFSICLNYPYPSEAVFPSSNAILSRSEPEEVHKKMDFDELLDCILYKIPPHVFREMVTRFKARGIQFPFEVDPISFIDTMRVLNKLDELESYLRERLPDLFNE